MLLYFSIIITSQKNAVGFNVPPIIEFYQTPEFSPW